MTKVISGVARWIHQRSERQCRLALPNLMKLDQSELMQEVMTRQKRESLWLQRHGRISVLRNGSRPCDSRNYQQDQETSSADFQ
jgi:hypothetical protein